MPLTVNGTMAQLTADLQAISETLSHGQLQSIMEDAAQPLLEQMRQNVHSRSGKLRAAIGTGSAKVGSGGPSITVGVHRKDWSGDEYYPAYVEFGHGGPRPAPPHPYIRPAVDARGEEALSRLAEGLGKLIK